MTLSPEEMARVRMPEPTHVTHHTQLKQQAADADFKKVYLDFLRSQLPISNLAKGDDAQFNDADYGNEIDASNTELYSYSDYDVGIGDAAKELKETRKKSAKTLSAKCALEGGVCASFNDCDTTSHIYKGYCTTDYSAVCCVPRVTICQANDGICTDDREACVAAGEIMGRKYNLKFYTWMDCNSTHVCCRPSQAFTPPVSNTRSSAKETNNVEDNEREVNVEPTPTRSTKPRKRKPVIGKKVKPLQGFQDAINPDFAGFPDSAEQQPIGRRIGVGGRMRVKPGRRRVAGVPMQRQVSQALPAYGIPYPGIQAQSAAIPGANQYLSGGYGANPYQVSDYMSAYTASSPGIGSVVSGYPSANNYAQTSAYGAGGYPSALLGQANPHQSLQDTSQPQTNSLFGNIFLK